MKIFYSWQSDLPNNTNRGFIEDALERAAKAIRNDNSLQVEPVVDRDTSGVPGSPNIAQTILDKISQSDIFVADVSIINAKSDGRPTPNPNVLVELGYALKCLGNKAIILIQNTAHGGPESLPFDLKMNRVITYSLTSGEEKTTERTKLVGQLRTALGLMIPELESLKVTETLPVEKEILGILSSGNKINLNAYLMEKTRSLIKQLKESPLMDISIQPSTDELVRRVNLVDSSLDELVKLFVAAAPWVEGDQLVQFGRVIEKLIGYGVQANGTYFKSWQSFQNYPALRLFYAGGMSALVNDNYYFIKQVAVTLKYIDPYRDERNSMITDLKITVANVDC